MQRDRNSVIQLAQVEANANLFPSIAKSGLKRPEKSPRGYTGLKTGVNEKTAAAVLLVRVETSLS